MSEFKTPGVFIEEIPKFPPSVAQVETAVPSFIGYTEIALDKENKPLKMVPTKISSLMDYETYFGKANKESIKLKDTTDEGLTLVKPNVKFLMYYSMQMYFANGGGPCYVVSVGDYIGDVINKSDLKLGLEASALQEESTIVVFPDATSLTDQEEFYALYQDAIAQADDLKNKFLIMDTFLGESKSEDEDTGFNTVEFLRNRIGRTMHAAAYFPHLKTVLNYRFNEDLAINHAGLQPANATGGFFAASVADLQALSALATAEFAELTPDAKVLIDIAKSVIAIVEGVNVTADGEISLTAVNSYLQDLKNEDEDLDYEDIIAIIADLIADVDDAQDKKGDADGLKLEALKTTNSVLYNQIKKLISELKVVLPPSTTMAGVYAKVDGTQGVWKSPANLGLNYVIAPTQKISDKEQESLNVDTNGKSINAIRMFTGKGNLVWGARTFDSESTEWKYISVRRLFDMVEKSVENAMQRFVFETNDANTWVKAKTMIENYLNQLWMSGALAGPTPEKAYYVIVGKETTSAQDVLEGRMNIEIGMAAVRPAEFIVLNFSHKLQEA